MLILFTCNINKLLPSESGTVYCVLRNQNSPMVIARPQFQNVQIEPL